MSSFHLWIVSSRSKPVRDWELTLNREGWRIAASPDFRAFSAQASADRVGLALLDWSLLGLTGQAHLNRFKSSAPGVSVLLTGPKAIPQDDIIRYFDAGADDFIPFTTPLGLLVAKLKAHLRRLLPSFASARDLLKTPNGDIRLDRSKRLVEVRKSGTHRFVIPKLTPTEFTLLALLLERPGAALERGVLLESLKPGPSERLIRLGTVDKHIESLRRKLGPHGGKIQTVYGVGYALREK